MSQRKEFVKLAQVEGTNRRELFQRFGISDERFHRTLPAEVIQGRSFRGLPDCQRAFDA